VDLRKYLNLQEREVCSVCNNDCPFWYGKMNADGFLDWYRVADRWWYGFLERIFPERYALDDIYARLFEVTDSDLLVDSSHFASWASVVARHPREAESIIVNMVRDGRAFVANYRRKGRSAEPMIHRWVKRVEDIETFLQTWPKGRTISLYEDLASTPESTVRELTEQLGLTSEPEMLEYWKCEHHNVGGNTGTRLAVTDYAGKPLSSRDSRSDIEYYEERRQQIFLDERWKKELTPEELEIFDRVGGDTDVRLGYSRSIHAAAESWLA